MKLIALALTCGMAVPVDDCKLETSLMARPVKRDAWTCAQDSLWGQTAAQISSSGTYDKVVCTYIPFWRPGMTRRVGP